MADPLAVNADSTTNMDRKSRGQSIDDHAWDLNGQNEGEGLSINGSNDTSMCCNLSKTTVYFSGYFLAVLSFVCGFNVKEMPKPIYPIIGNIQDPEEILLPMVWIQGVALLVVLWGVTHARQSIFLFFLPAQQTESRLEVIFVPIYFTFFGFWVGWSMNVNLGYNTSDWELFIPGIFVQALGEISCCCWFIHQRLRQRTNPDYGKTRGLLALRELLEVVSLAGYFLATYTLATLAYLLFNSLTALCLIKLKRTRY